MNPNGVAKHYDCLTAEERFRLILAAGARGDEAEQDRLVNAGGRITLTYPDHQPYAHAFNELTLLTFIELQEAAARYLEAFALADFSDDDEEPAGKSAEGDAGKRPAWQRSLDLALAAGYVLREKANGWKLFCERLNVSPFVLVERFPGFERLQCALTLAEGNDSLPGAAFLPEGFLRWLNRVRPAGEPERTEVPLTAEAIAAATGEAFRRRVDWWGGI